MYNKIIFFLIFNFIEKLIFDHFIEGIMIIFINFIQLKIKCIIFELKKNVANLSGFNTIISLSLKRRIIQMVNQTIWHFSQ
jgi:hypothetical protein